MTREEFESILEEAYIEGYNTAIEDIQEDILDEEAYDLENEYGYYNEARMDREGADNVAKNYLSKYKKDNPHRKTLMRYAAIAGSDRDYPNAIKHTLGKIEKDYGGNVPSYISKQAGILGKKMRQAREFGKIPTKSAHIKF